jgi:hypothetical protein
MDKTTRDKAEDRAFAMLERIQGHVVEGVRRVAHTVDSWWPEATASPVTDRLPEFAGIVDRGARLAERELDRDHRLAKRLIKTERGFLKDMVHAVRPVHTAHPAQKPAAKTAA